MTKHFFAGGTMVRPHGMGRRVWPGRCTRCDVACLARSEPAPAPSASAARAAAVLQPLPHLGMPLAAVQPSIELMLLFQDDLVAQHHW